MKEVIKQIEELGFEIEVDIDAITVLRNDKTVAWVYTNQPYSLDTAHMEFEKLNLTTKEKLFNLLLQLYQEPEYYWVLKGETK